MKLKSIMQSLAVSIFIVVQLQGINFENVQSFWNDRAVTHKNAIKTTLGVSALAGIGYFGKLLYNKIFNLFDEKVENEIVCQIILAFTSNSTIDKFSEPERESAFRKKAKLINMRLRVMEQIEILAHCRHSTFSKQHQMKLMNWYNKVKSTFSYIDIARESFLSLKNPYEQEYKNSTLITSVIEKQIIESIVFSCKPEAEYTAADIKKKNQITRRRINILRKLQNELSGFWLEMLSKNLHLINFFA